MKFVQGDILTPNKEERQVMVCHQVNCKGVMGAGLAKQVKKTHPFIYFAYKEKCREIKAGAGGLGDVQFRTASARFGYVVANIFGQDDYGRGKLYTDYNALRKALEEIAESFPSYTIRIPYFMGCGLAGGDWNIVSQIIEETLVTKGIDVEIWQLPKEK